MIHLAAEHKDNVSPTSLYYDVNVEGTKNILKCMDDFNIKNIIFISSVAVYGLNKNNPNENDITDPFNHYGKSKFLAENVLKSWYEKSSVNNVVIIRPSVIFGEENRGNVYNLFKQIVSKKFIMIGSGNNKKSMAYVGNVTSLIKKLSFNNKKSFEIYNYADKPDFTMNELILVIENTLGIKIPSYKVPYILGIFISYLFDLFSLLTNKKLKISSVRIKKFCATTQFCSEKVLENFKPPYSIKKALKKTLEYEFKKD